MSSKFYSEKELLNADVYDLYGLYYGFVCGLKYEGGVYVKVCVSSKTEEFVPDIDKIINMLKSKNIGVSSNDPLEYIIGLARQYGVDIPRRRVDREIKFLKGLVKPEEIMVIDKYVAGKWEKTFMVLKRPREAMYRGWRSEPEKPVPRIEYVRGKHVVSLTQGYLGVGSEIVIGSGGVGLRVEKPRGGRYIAWMKFLNDLKHRGGVEAYRVLTRIRDPLKHRRISFEEYSSLIEEIRGAGLSEEIIRELDKYIELEKSMSIYVDIPWNKILYVNDIVVAY